MFVITKDFDDGLLSLCESDMRNFKEFTSSELVEWLALGFPHTAYHQLQEVQNRLCQKWKRKGLRRIGPSLWTFADRATP